MSTQYYLRVRGRVLGPYDQEKIQSLAQRGQLGRMHEVSTDGAVWSRATAFPEIFTAAQPGAAAWLTNGGQTAVAAEPVAAVEDAYALAPAEQPASERPPQTSSQKWHYMAGGADCGPIEFSGLQMLAGTGQLNADDLVWSAGMPSWTAAKHVPGLVRERAITARMAYDPDAEPGNSQTELPSSVCRSAVESRGWAMFIAVMMYVYAALQGIAGISLLANNRGRLNVLIAQGVFFLIHAFLIGIGAMLLSSYASRLGGLRFSRAPAILERSLDALRGFWIYASIYLIVILALIGVAVVYAISLGADWSNEFD